METGSVSLSDHKSQSTLSEESSRKALKFQNSATTKSDSRDTAKDFNDSSMNKAKTLSEKA